ncbi:PLP-dependent aminotransferase family protein [Clostridium merdae]|uniref:MocR-like pyridoxine biosynthesis transcription factor PdxR n=1 Tax=Clostridium merdae TaxID=1958780 RepID=UPI000A268A67|nr:PLP-dependent aminotransferase family protein [Clostridium merdae]
MLQINPASAQPIYQQIYEQIRADILNGSLVEGKRITSTRALAKELQIGRNTVESAYAQLVLEGYLTNQPSSGYVVNSLQFNLNQRVELPRRQQNAVTAPDEDKVTIRYSFQYGSLSANAFPDKLWRKYTNDLLGSTDLQKIQSYGDGKGDFSLRVQLKDYLYHSRGVNCEADQIILCSGTQSALEILIQLRPYENKQVAMEEPCYNGASIVFRSNGYEILPVPVHHDGICLADLTSSSARMVHITPSHQFPTGVVLPIHKRIQLLNWAKEHDAILIEDDYDSEFRYHGRPIPSLQSIDTDGRVVYIGTFSKSLSPGLRMAYIILPKWLLPKYEERFSGYQCTVPLMEQIVMARLIADGHWEKHNRKICLAHKKKHDILLQALEAYMGNRVNIHGQQAGLHLMLEFLEGQQESVLIEQALEQQVKVCPVSPFWLNAQNYKKNCVILGYGMISENDIPNAVKLLARAWFD